LLVVALIWKGSLFKYEAMKGKGHKLDEQPEAIYEFMMQRVG
jgi:hypothetical protein